MTSASSDGGMDACSISSDNGRSPRHRAGGDQHHAATAFGDNGVGCGRRHQGRLEQLGRTEATPGGVSGGASCAISHNLQSNSSRCSRRPMTSTPSNHKRLNLNGRYELRWRNLSPTVEARNSAGLTINGDWQMAARSCTCHTIWTETGSCNALYSRLLRLYVYNEEHLPPQE